MGVLTVFYFCTFWIQGFSCVFRINNILIILSIHFSQDKTRSICHTASASNVVQCNSHSTFNWTWKPNRECLFDSWVWLELCSMRRGNSLLMLLLVSSGQRTTTPLITHFPFNISLNAGLIIAKLDDITRFHHFKFWGKTSHPRSADDRVVMKKKPNPR